MIESPLIQEIVAERMHGTIEAILDSRFHDVTADMRGRLRSIQDETRLRELAVAAAHCTTLDEFRAKLSV